MGAEGGRRPCLALRIPGGADGATGLSPTGPPATPSLTITTATPVARSPVSASSMAPDLPARPPSLARAPPAAPMPDQGTPAAVAQTAGATRALFAGKNPPSLAQLSDALRSKLPATAAAAPAPATDEDPKPSRPRLAASISSAALARRASVASLSSDTPGASPISRQGSIATLVTGAAPAEPNPSSEQQLQQESKSPIKRRPSLPSLEAIEKKLASRRESAAVAPLPCTCEAEESLPSTPPSNGSTLAQNTPESTFNASATAVTSRKDSVSAPSLPELPKTPTALAHPLPPRPSPAPQVGGAPHPLHHAWVFRFQNARTAAEAASAPRTEGQSKSEAAYTAAMKTLGEADTVESFARLMNWIKKPGQLEVNSTLSVFRKGCAPTWEAEENSRGGKWSLTIHNNIPLLDRCWLHLVLAIVGQELEEDDEINGAVMSLRSKGNRLALWLKAIDDDPVTRINALGKRLMSLLDISRTTPGISLEYSFHRASYAIPSSRFMSINTGGAPSSTARNHQLGAAASPPFIRTTPIRSQSMRLAAPPSPTRGEPLGSLDNRLPSSLSASSSLASVSEGLPGFGKPIQPMLVPNAWRARVASTPPVLTTSSGGITGGALGSMLDGAGRRSPLKRAATVVSQ